MSFTLIGSERPEDCSLPDPRVLQNLIKVEHLYVVTQDYFATMQTEINPNMRKICLNWVFEVSVIYYFSNKIYSFMDVCKNAHETN